MKLKIAVLLICLCVVFTALAAAACGEKKEGENANPIPGGVVDGGQAPDENTPEDPTEPPPPTDPPPTEPPTEPIDPDLPYYDYLDEEFKRFGFEDGDRIIADTEQGIMDLLRGKDTAKIIIDVSEDGVPFETAARFAVTRQVSDNAFWEIAAELNFASDKTLTEGDIIAGVMWMRDGGGPDPAQCYLAYKTPTNGWGSEGDMSVNYIELDPGDGWQKIYFYGENAVDEDPASTAVFCIFLGYEPHTIEIGGIYVMRYPSTDANISATRKMPW